MQSQVNSHAELSCACRGGVAFVATQALGWVLFSVSLIGLSWLIMQVAAGVAYCIRCWAIGVGYIMFAAQLVSMPHRFASFVAAA